MSMCLSCCESRCGFTHPMGMCYKIEGKKGGYYELPTFPENEEDQCPVQAMGQYGFNKNETYVDPDHRCRFAAGHEGPHMQSRNHWDYGPLTNESSDEEIAAWLDENRERWRYFEIKGERRSQEKSYMEMVRRDLDNQAKGFGGYWFPQGQGGGVESDIIVAMELAKHMLEEKKTNEI